MAKYSVLEASKILNLSKQAVVNRIKKGDLKGEKENSGQWIVEIDESEVPSQDETRYQEVPSDGQEVPSQDEDRQERRPRRENDDALLKNNEFLQLTTASNQELVARLTRSIEEQKSRESKAWITAAMIFGSTAIIAISLLFFYFSNQTIQIKEESKSLRDEMKLEHQTAIESLGTKYQENLKSMETRYQARYQESETRYQEAKKDYQARYQEASADYQKKEGILQDQIELLKTQNKELIELLKVSKSGNLEAGQ